MNSIILLLTPTINDSPRPKLTGFFLSTFSLDVGDLRVDSEGMILSGSQEGGASGNISIAASGKVYIAQAGISPNLDASAYGNGDGGDIEITADEMAIAAGGGVQNVTLGEGKGFLLHKKCF